MSVTPGSNSGSVVPSGPVGGTTPTASNSWIQLSYSDATLVDNDSVIDTFDGTDVVTNAVAATFESTAGDPPRWKWSLDFDPADYVAVHIMLVGVTFPNGSSNAVGVLITDSDTPATAEGLMWAKTNTGSGMRCASGRAWASLGDTNPGISGETLYGRCSLYVITGPSNVIDDSHAYLLDSNGIAGNGNHTTNGTNRTWDPSSGVILSVAIEQAASIQTFTPGTLYYRLVPKSVLA